MKWNKFQDELKKHPFLAHDLTWRGVGRFTKEFVRTKVGYIAFRPFETLNMSAVGSSIGIPLKSKYIHAKEECYHNVDYQISFHIEGENDGSRLRYVTDDEGKIGIQAHIDDIQQWFDNCFGFIDKQLVWERVIKRTTRGSSRAGLTEMNLEIYLFPKFYRFKPMPRVPLPPPDPAYTAYLRHEKMPPIIPNMSTVAL